MKTTLLPAATALAALCAAAPVTAHTLNFDNDACNIELQSTAAITSNTLKVTTDSGEVFHFAGDTLTIDGNPVALSAAQKRQVERYQRASYDQAKLGVGLAMSALDLTVDAVSGALEMLNIDIEKDNLSVVDKVHGYQKQLHKHLQNDGVITVGPEGIAQLDVMSDEIEEELEAEIEALVMQNMGSFIGLALRAAVLGEEAFEKRIEARAEAFEEQMDARSDALEGESEAFCKSLQKFDALEQQLKQAIPALDNYELVERSRKRHSVVVMR